MKRFQEVVRLTPGDASAQHNLEVEEAAAQQTHGAR